MGSPKEKSGTKPAVEVALFAPSGAATPSIAPLPNSLGSLGDPLLKIVGHERGDRGAQPGRSPRMIPTPVQRSIVPGHRLISAQVGIQLLSPAG